MEFKERGWITDDDELNYVKATIKDKNGVECYSIEGKFTEKLHAENLQTREKWVIYTPPKKQENSELMYNMGLESLQINVMSEEL